MALIWNLLSATVTIIVNFILVFPILGLTYEIFTIHYPVSEMLTLRGWIQHSMAFLGIPGNGEELFFSIFIIIICSLITAIFPYFPVLKGFLHTLRHQDNPTEEEQAIIDEALSILYKNGLQKGKYQFFVTHCEYINAFASGANEITLTSMMLSVFPPRLIAGVIAHEIGHHMHGDVKTQNLLYGLSLLSVACFYIIKGVAGFCIFILRFIPFLGIVAVLFGMVLNVILMIYSFFMNWPVYIINMFFSRQSEYAADDNAFTLGVGEELRDAMVLMMKHADDGPWWQIPMNDHPRGKSRIKRMNKKLSATEKDEWNKIYGLSWKQYLASKPALNHIFQDKSRLY